MRKLEYLRSAIRKCITMDDVQKIQLPEEFRLSDDEDNYPFLSAVPVEKNGKDCLAVFVVHTRIVKRDEVLARYGIFSTSQEGRLFETYVIPISKKFKFESPTKINPTKDYSNWGMTKEGTPCMPPMPDIDLDYIPALPSLVMPDVLLELYAAYTGGKEPSSFAEVRRYVETHIR